MPRGRVHDHAGRLVQYQKIRVLVDDVKRDGFRQKINRRRGGNAAVNLIAGTEAIAGLYSFLKERNQTATDKLGDIRPRASGNRRRQVCVYPLACGLFVGDD